MTCDFPALNLSEALTRCERRAVTRRLPFRSRVKESLTFPSRAPTCASRTQAGQVSPVSVCLSGTCRCVGTGLRLNGLWQPRSFADNYHLGQWSVFTCWWRGALFRVWSNTSSLRRLLLGNLLCGAAEIWTEVSKKHLEKLCDLCSPNQHPDRAC